MKTLQKILLVLLVVACVFTIIPQSRVMAAADAVDGLSGHIEADAGMSDDLQSTIGKLLGFLQVASGLVAVLMIAITGFRYIIGTPELKDEMKKTAFPIIIGIVLVFGAVSIAKFFIGVAGN